MVKRKTVFFIPLKILFLLFIVVSISSVVIASVLYFRKKYEISNSVKLHPYQYMEVRVNSPPNYGIVRTNDELIEDDFISYRNTETGNQVVISNFGTSEYECFGSCSCSNENRNEGRRFSSSTILRKGLFLFLSAVSVTMAMTVAEKSFQEHCKHFVDFDEECDPNDIIGDLERCVSKIDGNLYGKGETQEFSCQGFCDQNPKVFKYEHLGIEAIENLKRKGGHRVRAVKVQGFEYMHAPGGTCGDYDVDGEVEVKRDAIFVSTRKAGFKFLAERLRDFCRGMTMVTWFHPDRPEEKMRDPLCVGLEENIWCVPINDYRDYPSTEDDPGYVDYDSPLPEDWPPEPGKEKRSERWEKMGKWPPKKY